MPAFTKSRVGSWAGIREELLTMVWPRSAKNSRKRRRISLLFMDGIYFLSNGVLIISKTNQSSKKTSGISRLERSTQFQTFHFSRHRVSKRGPLRLVKSFGSNIFGDSAGQQFLANSRPTAVLAP